jgi:hypothetical protein
MTGLERFDLIGWMNALPFLAVFHTEYREMSLTGLQ